jgi:hypothetical protein
MDPPSPIAIAPPSGMFTSYKVKGVLGSASGTIDTESQIAMIKAAIGGEDALQIIDNRGLGAIRRLRK